MSDTPQLSKLHGLGNDFILIAESDAPALPALAPALCDRHLGVGADGVIVWSFLQGASGADARMVIYNQDGSRPQMCGNGIRCLAALLNQLTGQRTWRILTDAGLRTCHVSAEDEGLWSVRVQMGAPVLGTARLDAAETFDGAPEAWTTVSMGNPHVVAFAQPDLETIDALGARLNGGHAAFPEGVNVELVRTTSPTRHEVVVYERGVGRTQACGTGACAVAAAAWATGASPDGQAVEVVLPGGPLMIERDASGEIWMTGPAELVFTGALRLDWLARRESAAVTLRV